MTKRTGTIALAAFVLFTSLRPLSAATKKSAGADALDTQILLDRAGFSPGEIDGRWGSNVEHVLSTFQEANSLKPTGKLDSETSAALVQAAGAEPALTEYVITEDDVAGPFFPNIPATMEEKAKLPRLGYKDLAEKLGEKFHLSPELLASLNRKAKFAAGETIRVPSVEPLDMAAAMRAKNASDKDSESTGTHEDSDDKGTSKSSVTINVSKSRAVLTVTDADNKVIFAAPVTTGSEHDPLPIGDWKVDGVERFPPFSYNPNLFWDAKASSQKARIPPGPNNPVGVTWIALTKKHYGIHGTPEPGKVGHAESHGCVRLSNWAVLHVAGLVKPGTKVVFTP